VRIGRGHGDRDRRGAATAQGLASGLLNTAAQIGTAIGIAVLATIAAARTQALAGSVQATSDQLVAGFRVAYLVAAAVTITGCLAVLLLVRGAGGERELSA
jgi:hypothetical protein